MVYRMRAPNGLDAVCHAARQIGMNTATGQPQHLGRVIANYIIAAIVLLTAIAVTQVGKRYHIGSFGLRLHGSRWGLVRKHNFRHWRRDGELFHLY